MFSRKIMPAENMLVSILAMGEGWHNYHHVFPWDYKTSELGNYSLNPTTAVIDFFSYIGWAYDCKTVSANVIQSRSKRTGDGSYKPPCGTVGGCHISEEDEPDDFLLPCKNKEE
jgi:stearoyl-CoA desaturase (Delta-9 desaturase)